MVNKLILEVMAVLKQPLSSNFILDPEKLKVGTVCALSPIQFSFVI